MVYLVGAGPGDPKLITLRGVECLKKADVVLYDYLVNPVIAEHAPEGAQLICLGRHQRRGQQAAKIGSRIWKQHEINERMVELVRAGKTVVRLKGGDPAVFARGGEEADYLRAQSVRFEIVPGITAALAAGSHLGIPITHRDMASAVALITGHFKAGSGGKFSSPPLDYTALAKFPGTLVFYMGVTTAEYWSTQLMKNGLSPETPVAIVRRVSLPDQRSIFCKLANVAECLTPYSKFPPPVVVIVGDVATHHDALNWFEQRPLFGQTVLVTRPKLQCSDLGNRLTEYGANVVYQPAIAIQPPECFESLDQAIRSLAAFDWIVFSSANGVHYFFDRLFQVGGDLRFLHDAKLAAIGSATAAALKTYHLNVDVLPAEFRAESLAAALSPEARGAEFLLIRASRGRELLAEELSKAGGNVTQIVAYTSRDVDFDDRELLEQLAEQQIDWITVTSSAIARSLNDALGPLLQNVKVASISPVTTATLHELGIPVHAEAEVYTMQGLVDAIIQASATVLQR